MKSLLIFPPQWIPTNPYYSIPLLNGQLVAAGFKTTAIDLNIEYYNEILTPQNLYTALTTAEKERKQLNFPNYIENVNTESKEETKLKKKLLEEKKSILNKYFSENINHAQIAIDYINSAINILKSKEFYDTNNYYKAQRVFEYALELISLNYAPTKIGIMGYSNPILKANYNDIKFQIFNKEFNPFSTFFDKYINSIDLYSYDLILISITGKTQLVPALTLANKFKLKCNSHITIGGNLINRVYSNFIKHPEIFDIYIDSILRGDGEDSIIQLAKAIKNNTSLSNVSGLIYLDENKNIKQNNLTPLQDINHIAPITLDGYNIKKYYTPDIIGFIQATKGCYWGNCTFCDMPFGKKYNEKDITKLVNEIEYLNKKYNISKFWFVDESISPKYYEKFADEVIKRKLKINYYGLARLEKGFTQEVSKKLYESGLKALMWGFECASERVFKLMNKGVVPEERLNILRNTAVNGIWNYIFIIFGFPSETTEEADYTVNTVNENKDIIDSFHSHIFSLQRHSQILNYAAGYKIDEIIEEEEFEECLEKSFSPSLNMLSKEELQNKRTKLETLFWKGRESSAFRYLLSTDFLLYLSHYGKENLSNLQFQIKKKKIKDV